MTTLGNRLAAVTLASVIVVAAMGCAKEGAPSPASAASTLGYGEKLDAPEIDRPVVDTLGALSPEDVARLSRKLHALRDKTGAQMAVLVVASTGGEPIEEFSMRVAEKWQGGDAERDDGLLLTLAMADRRMRLEVGYGLEGVIPDVIAKRILDGMREDLRGGDTAKAISGAIGDVARRIPRLDPSVLDGGFLARTSDFLAGLPVTLAAALTALFFLLYAPGAKNRPRKKVGAGPRPPVLPSRGRKAFGLLALALTIVAALLSWAYAGIEGFPHEEPVAYALGAIVLVAVGRLADRKARTLESNGARWMFFAPIFFEATFLVLALSGTYLGSDAAFFLMIPFAFLAIFAFVLCVAALPLEPGSGSGGGGSYSSPSYSSSSSSNSSSSQDYSGGGGGFGGGGASSSW